MDIKLREDIFWVGYVDWAVRDFHGYMTDKGSSYNAYLICDEKNTLIDTVKAPYVETLLENIKQATPLSSIEYVVVNHAEPDHAGGLSAVMAACPQATIVCNKKCKAILGHYHDTSEWKFHLVTSGDTLSIGQRTLTFIDTPMVHWPESMFTYIPEEKILFSMDAFGQHYSASHRFDDEVDIHEVMKEAKKYYANIVMLYGKNIKATMEKVAPLDIDIIAPAHGIIWRSNILQILAAYRDWVLCKPKTKVLVIYDSMWNSTRSMAEAIIDGAIKNDVTAKLIHVRSSNLTDIATEVLDAAAIAFGSATLNMGMMPEMGALLTYLKGLRPTGKAACAFGSYGWGKGGAEDLDAWIRTMKFDVFREPLKAQWKPTPEMLQECFSLGCTLAEHAKQYTLASAEHKTSAYTS
jgi:flavorubredoxin